MILVTGAGGFIGGHMAKYLLAKGYEVRSVDIKPNEFMDIPNLYLTDLRSYQNCMLVTKGVDRVYNFAANMGGIGFITKVKADIMRDNVKINCNILESCRLNHVERLFFSSSACVYPQNLQLKPDVDALKESDVFPAYPDSAYGWEKLFAELMMQAYNEDYGLDIRIARFHNIYGPCGTYKGGREKAPAALCRKVAESKDGGSITIWGDGKQTRSFLYIEDALEAIYKLMNSNHIEPLNIGSDELVTIDELADIIIKISGKQITKQHTLDAPQGVRGRNSDLTLIKEVIGWQPKVSYEAGLTKTYQWIEGLVKKD